MVKRLAADGVTCEVCPSSNVALGIAAGPAQVPLRPLFEAGVPVALGADDPLLFGPRLAAQYEIARHAHGFTDAELADLARASVLGSAAPSPLRLYAIENYTYLTKTSEVNQDSKFAIVNDLPLSGASAAASDFFARQSMSDAGRTTMERKYELATNSI